MKRFKKRIGINGSVTLRKAFVQELIALGYHLEGKLSPFETHPDLIVGYLNSDGFNNCYEGYCDHELNTFKLKLPQDWNKALKLAAELVVEEEPKITYSTGQRFNDISDGGDYILAHCGDKCVALINLRNGNLYSDKIMVNSLSRITEEEFEEICGGDDFKLIK